MPIPDIPLRVTRGAHDPELGVLDDQALRVLVDLRRHVDLGVVLREFHRRHLADVDVLVLDEGLAGLDPLGCFEEDGDRRAFAQVALHRDPQGHDRGHERNDPDDRKAHPLLRHGYSLRIIR